MPFMSRKTIYLLLCVAGAVAPLSQFIPWVGEHGFDMRLFVEQLFANRISSFFAMDVIVSALVLISWIHARRVPYGWLAILGTLTVGVSFGLPLHLYLQERFTK